MEYVMLCYVCYVMNVMFYVVYVYVMDVIVVLAERKLTSYVYAVGKQPSDNL